MAVQIIVLIVCLVFSAFFAAAEVAFNMVGDARLEKAAEQGGWIDRLALRVSRHYNFALTSMLVGSNIAHFIFSSVAASVAITLLYESGRAGENTAALIATAVSTLIVLIFGELGPKTLASSRDKLSVRICALPLMIVMILLSPFAFLINLLIGLVSRLFAGIEPPAVTTDELASIIETGENEGSIGEERSELLQSAIDFRETTVKEIMIPRVDMQAIDIEDGVDGALQAAKESSYSRIPVYEESVDNIIGILVVQQLFKALTDTRKEEIDLRDLLVEPCFIHMTVKLPDALDVLREERTHVMIVLDEFGGTMGIVTMEDILEELVGDIWDEDEETEQEIVPLGEDRYRVEGDMNIFDFFEYLEIEEGDFDSDYTTVGGWAIEMLEGFPEEGASFAFRNLTVTIDSIEDHRVQTLTVAVDQTRSENPDETE